MTNLLLIVLLAAVQGVTEFLPVSSSGHLVILGKLSGLDAESNQMLGIFMHAGSLGAIVVFYFKLLCGFFRRDQLHLMLMIIAGSVPAGIAGVALKLTGGADFLFDSPLVTGMAMLITGMLLRLTGKKNLVPDQENAVSVKEISLRQALTIGLVQMAAILPGISRSGSTIAAGLFCGVKREDAAAFSFLLALPAIAGATLIEIVGLIKAPEMLENHGTPLMHIIVAVLVAFLVSLGSLTLVVNVVKKSRLSAFSWYLFAVGIAVIIWQAVIFNGVK